jgi:uncharacterized protein YkwD
MTLAKTKPRRTSTSHRKRTGKHHKKSHDYVKAYWPYLPIVAILMFGLVASSWISGTQRDILGYASEMSVQNLLNETNNQRIANGLGSLAINGKLNQAAQNKANDMAARDYWSHNTPDGQTPWTFVTAAGYSYQTVGENLAYGFSTSSATVTGWMNSAGHRANILNVNYQEVGFGVINIADYQSSGPQTLVVAMYAKPATTQVAQAAPAPAPVVTTKPRTETPVATPKPTPEPIPSTNAETPKAAADTPAPTSRDDTVVAQKAVDPNETVEEQRVARIQVLTAGKASWSMFAMSLIAAGALIIFIMRHSVAWHRVFRKGERFMFKHPLLDIVVISLATIGYILTQTSGLIK